MKLKHKLRDFMKFTLAAIICLGILSVGNHSKDFNNNKDGNGNKEAGLFYRKFISPNDNEFLQEIKEKFLHPPSTQPYSLQSQKDSFQARIYRGLRFKYTNKVIPFIRALFASRHGVEKRYFVEAGALDGEFLSNTLFLEKEFGWNGLLIEPLTESYKKLLGKHRKAWACHCCLGTKPYPYETQLAFYGKNGNTMMVPKEVQSAKSLVVDSLNFANMKMEDILELNYENIQCLPIHSILKTLNLTKIDFFSLDLEGNEFEILKTFPWSEVVVDIWAVEYKATKNFGLSDELKTADINFISWFDQKGYDLNLFVSVTEDYIFIRRNSSVVNVKITVD